MRSRLERSVTAAQHQVRGFAVKRPARCDDAGGGVWTCRIHVLTASPEGATDAVDIDYRVKLGAGSCWTATFASGRASPLHACPR